MFVDFYSTTFKDELADYWINTVSNNFVYYCDPQRDNNTFWIHCSAQSQRSVQTSAQKRANNQLIHESADKSDSQKVHKKSNENTSIEQCTQHSVCTEAESVEIVHSEYTENTSLLDIDSLLRKSSVVQLFINKHGVSVFESQLNSFLQSVCILLDIDLADLYFEDDITTRITSTQTYTFEVHTLAEKQTL